MTKRAKSGVVCAAVATGAVVVVHPYNRTKVEYGKCCPATCRGAKRAKSASAVCDKLTKNNPKETHANARGNRERQSAKSSPARFARERIRRQSAKEARDDYVLFSYTNTTRALSEPPSSGRERSEHVNRACAQRQSIKNNIITLTDTERQLLESCVKGDDKENPENAGVGEA